VFNVKVDTPILGETTTKGGIKMEYKLVKKSEAFDSLLNSLAITQTVYAVRVSRSKEFEDQWVRFYYIAYTDNMTDITAEIAALFELQMVYGEPAARVDGCDDKALINLVEQLSDLLFNFPTALQFCRL